VNDPTEPYWLEGKELEAIHHDVIAASGGLAGIGNRGLLASALVAPQTLWHYAAKPPTLVDLAAKFAYGMAKNHAFVDGYKRISFIAAYTFLAMNEW